MEFLGVELTAELGVLAIIIGSIIFWKEKKEEELLSIRITNEMKGFAIILIFAVHILSQPTLFGYGGYGVGVFLFLSGYGLFQSDKLQNANPKLFIIKRLRRVLPAFLLYMIVFASFWIFYPSFTWPVLSGHQPTNTLSFLYSIFAFSIIWYIGFLFFWYLAYFLLLRQKMPTQVKIGLLWLCGLGIIILRPFENGDPLRMFHEWFVYVLCFPLGVLTAYYYKKIKEIAEHAIFKSLIVKTILCVLVFLFIELTITLSKKIAFKSIHYPLTSLLFVLGIIMIWEFFLKKWRSKLLEFIGKVSYEIYLFHYLIIVIISRILGESVVYTNELMAFLFVFGISILIAYLTKWIIMRIEMIKAFNKNDMR